MSETELKYWDDAVNVLSDAFETEYWKKIENHDGYSVSTEGRVMNNKTKHIFKPSQDKNGYKHVGLRVDGTSTKYYTVHRLVALGFIPNPNNLSDVNHKDPNSVNDNSVRNLEWMSRMENTQAVNTKKGAGGCISVVYSEADKTKIIGWDAKLRYMGKMYHYYDNDKEAVEKWLNDRNEEIKNKLPVTDLTIKKDPKGSVSVCKNSWRVRIALNSGDRWTKSVKTEAIGNKLRDYMLENVKNDNIKTKEDADEYFAVIKPTL
tara:strand:+ start:141 stop:926 length:786 start_codon:yes stop_codon:yes gene_type:complete